MLLSMLKLKSQLPSSNTKLTIHAAQSLIVKIFNNNVKGNSPSYNKSTNSRHDGKEGHWLESQMGIPHNNKNEPDLHGFEMKKQTKGKTTFGDWSADFYMFKSTGNKNSNLTKDNFLKLFGKQNLKKKNRYSWSGEPCPKIDSFNGFGQKLIVDNELNILAVYDFKYDERPNKAALIPSIYQSGQIILAQWNHESIKSKLEKKFNKLGFFKCLKNENNVYNQIAFGKPINFNIWINLVKSGVVFFDSGMYQGNNRNYSQWRANNTFWDSLITTKF